MTTRVWCSYDPAMPAVWRLEREYARATSVGVVAVREGFLSDGASIPRHLHGILGGPWGAYFPAALIHDALYCLRPPALNRKDADHVFLELLLRDRVERRLAVTMHAAVRAFGEA